MILPIAIFSITGIAFFVLSVLVQKKSGATSGDVNKAFAGILRVFAIATLVIGNTYAILDHKGWSGENIQSFKMVSLITVCLAMVLIGIRFFRINRAGIARSSGLIWIILWLAMGGYGYTIVSKSNEGWTEDKKKEIINKCPIVKYERLCYLDQVMKMFPNPADYNKMTPAQQDKLNKAIEAKCLLCDEAREEKVTETVDGLPDDF